MQNVLVTGGTVFVSRYIAEYFSNSEKYRVYVLNRGTHPQSEGVTLIRADRHSPADALRGMHFDMVIDVTAYTGADIDLLLDALGSFDQYIMISSSAVYPEYGVQPFKENSELAENRYWGVYGTNKIAAERALLRRVPNAYILRPPYLYGRYNNVYREAFVFECAEAGRPFYLPGDGSMKLQFFHVRDLCRMIEIIAEQKPAQHIFNVGNRDAVSVKRWVELCYQALGKTPEFVNIYDAVEQRNYFSFSNYAYYLDVTAQDELLPGTMDLLSGLTDAYAWYRNHGDQVNRKNYLDYIRENFEGRTSSVGGVG